MKPKKGDWILVKMNTRKDRYSICHIGKITKKGIGGPWTGWDQLKEIIKSDKLRPAQYDDPNDYYKKEYGFEFTILPKSKKKRMEYLIQQVVLEAL